MKYILLLGVYGHFFALTTAFGQQNQEIVAWVSQHPTVHIFSESNYQLLDDEFKTKLDGKVIVYHDKITLDQLLAYDGIEKSESSPTPAKDEDAVLIKTWLGTHSDVKVITQSQYQAMSEDRKELYHSIGALILIGESITAQDIRNYQY